jgi:hypothetical protein
VAPTKPLDIALVYGAGNTASPGEDTRVASLDSVGGAGSEIPAGRRV